MNVRCIRLMIGGIGSIVALSAHTGWAGPPEGLATFVEAAAADLSASPLQISQFQSAKLDTVEDLGKAGGNDRYLCWLKNDQGRVGYIAAVSEGSSYHIMSLSATTAISPDYFVRHLQPSEFSEEPVRWSLARHVSSVADVPLVAARRTVLGVNPIDLSETACSLSSLLNHVQRNEKMLLFAHPGSGADSEYVRRCQVDPNGYQDAKVPSAGSFRDEYRAIMQESTSQEQTAEQRTEFQAQRRELIKPIVRRRLLDPVNAEERLEVLRAEWITIGRVTRVDISEGMKDAVLLQQDYLVDGGADVDHDLHLFFQTRGRTVRVTVSSLDKTPSDSLPSLIVGPDGVAGVILGCVDVGEQRFVLVYFPKTGTPVTMTLAEKKRAIRLAHGLPAEPNWLDDPELKKALVQLKESEELLQRTYREKGLPAPPIPERDPGQRAREWAEQAKAAEQKMLIVEDAQYKNAGGMTLGVHMVLCSCLTSWQVVHIDEVAVGHNWGQGSPQTDR